MPGLLFLILSSKYITPDDVCVLKNIYLSKIKKYLLKWPYQIWRDINRLSANVSFFLFLLSSLIRIPLGILSVNIKISAWPLDGRESSPNNLVSGTTGGLENSVYFFGYLLITTEGLLLPVFWEATTFLFLFNLFSFPSNLMHQYFGCSRILIQCF